MKKRNIKFATKLKLGRHYILELDNTRSKISFVQSKKIRSLRVGKEEAPTDKR